MINALACLGWKLNSAGAMSLNFTRETNQVEYLSVSGNAYIHEDGLGNWLFDRDTDRCLRHLML